MSKELDLSEYNNGAVVLVALVENPGKHWVGKIVKYLGDGDYLVENSDGDEIEVGSHLIVKELSSEGEEE